MAHRVRWVAVCHLFRSESQSTCVRVLDFGEGRRGEEKILPGLVDVPCGLHVPRCILSIPAPSSTLTTLTPPHKVEGTRPLPNVRPKVSHHGVFGVDNALGSVRCACEKVDANEKKRPCRSLVPCISQTMTITMITRSANQLPVHPPWPPSPQRLG